MGKGLGAFVVAVMLATPVRARAAPDKQACVDAATRGQIQRDDAKFRSASEAFEFCANEACPAVVRESCATWLAELRQRTPRLTIRIAGADQGDVALRVDGKPAALARPLVLDPGRHNVLV